MNSQMLGIVSNNHIPVPAFLCLNSKEVGREGRWHKVNIFLKLLKAMGEMSWAGKKTIVGIHSDGGIG